MIRNTFALFLPLLGITILPAQQPMPEGSVQQKFVSQGTIRLHLESGGYTITPGDSENIVVTCHARREEKLKNVRVAIKLMGATADVYVRNTPNDNFTAVIEVPRRSNLWARLTAGDLNVGDIEGDKDLEIRAGQLSIEIPRPQEYGQREASVLTGSIKSSAFGVSTGGLFRSFHQQGPGKYRLHAHLLAGDIRLRGAI
ncbi:MAG TPA: hypothetical protein VKE93_15370 [Candidatus Angelobacter sp.]|nr:hypothetical protein [Candidatus Angelobacter sp.]